MSFSKYILLIRIFLGHYVCRSNRSPEIIIFSDCFSIAIRENCRLFFLDTFPRGPRARPIFSPTTLRPYLIPKDVYKPSRGRSEAVDRLTPGGAGAQCCSSGRSGPSHAHENDRLAYTFRRRPTVVRIKGRLVPGFNAHRRAPKCVYYGLFARCDVPVPLVSTPHKSYARQSVDIPEIRS